MQPKSITLLAVIFTLVNYSAPAQSFFSTLPPPKPTIASATFMFADSTLNTLTSSTYFILRPILAAAITFVGSASKAMAGTGISWQNITYNFSTLKNYCNYAVSLLVFEGFSTDDSKPLKKFSCGLMVSILNNNIGAGIAYTGGKLGPMVLVNMNFNN